MKLQKAQVDMQITQQKAELDMAIKQRKFDQEQAIRDAEAALKFRESRIMPAKKAAKKAAKKIAVPIKLERWFNDIKSVTHLQELIDDPVFQQAVAILRKLLAPR